MSDAAPLVVHEHRHVHHWQQPQPERRDPVRRDPAARYDSLGRKVPKRVGAMDGLRALPWLARTFEFAVPDEHFTVDRQDDQAIVRCRCEEVVQVAENDLERCPGDCGRWFAFVGGRVRVAKEPDPPAFVD